MAFLVFEGIDGAGKSTLIEALVGELRHQGIAHLTTREPGGTPLGEEIRQMLLKTTGQAPHPRAELLLYEAARAQHVELKIKPALAAGQWVICDRFTASTVAFQAGGRALQRSDIDCLNDFATQGLEPDLWVLLDLDVEESLRRRATRESDRFEREDFAFHQTVRETYLALAQDSAKWLVLNAAQPPRQLQEQLVGHLRGLKWLA